MNLIFDFDGTICDSLPLSVRVANKYLDSNNYQITTKEEVRMLGVKKAIQNRNIPNHKIPKLLIRARKDIVSEISSLNLFEGIKDTLIQLSHKHSLGILTSNSAENVNILLNKNNLENFFEFVYSNTNIWKKHINLKRIISKYNLDYEDTVYIGDETRDIEAARKAGIKSIAVTWGYESESVLKKSNPDVLIVKPQELLSIITEDRGLFAK